MTHDTSQTSPSPQLILASSSPRRRELLDQIGVRYHVQVASLDERRLPDETPVECVERLALAKAQLVYKQLQRGDVLVLGADTAVVLDGMMMGKPADRVAHLKMMSTLSGRKHEVLTAVALVGARGASVALSRSSVHLCELSAAEAGAYWDSGEPHDKAGGYAIQGLGAIFVTDLQGSYSGVMGLPLFETAALLQEHGVLPAWKERS